MKKYIGIAGTNSAQSTNRQLLNFIKQHWAADFSVELAEIADLPLFEKVPEENIPAAALQLGARIAEADGVIIATPEYDHAVPAVLSSALAWLSYKQNPLAGKPVLIIGASYGALGTSRAQAQLRQILDSPEIRASVMPSSEFLVGHSLEAFDETGALKNQELTGQLDGLVRDFGLFVDVTAQLVNTIRNAKIGADNVDWKTHQ